MSRHGQMRYSVTARGLRRYEIEIWHDELSKYQLIRGDDQNVVAKRANAKMAEWDEMCARRSEREQKNQSIEEKKKTADERTAEAQNNHAALERILAQALEIDPAIDWDSLKRLADYAVPKPSKIEPEEPKYPEIPAEPRIEEFPARLSMLDKLSHSRREQKEQEAADAFKNAHTQWQSRKEQILDTHSRQRQQFEQEKQHKEVEYLSAVQRWEEDREKYLKERDEYNAEVDRRAATYLSGEAQEVLCYCDQVLANSKYPDYFPKIAELDYDQGNKVLLVDYQCPPPNAIPTVKDIRYTQSTDRFSETHISESQRNKLYDDALYQTALRTIYEIFKADKAAAISSVAFNGYVKSASSSTGKEINPCVLSIQANKEEFMQIGLANVNPKACFKQLKGIGSSRLSSLTPIAPVLKMNRVDRRFIESYEVADNLDAAVNLALMDWEDFEHLVRELFEKEYGAPGNEVKVTRASRDYGVDAVVFDSDPIRGGKIVIQAKRYTNTVGVSAVRDLYGTVMNEGAMKGILVTTSDYGPESYDFAKGKPLTLLNGSNLLFLLEKYGHRARIDLEEAKRLMAQG